MDTHEMALRTYEAIQKRKRKKEQLEQQKERDAASVGWNGYERDMIKRQKRYYNRRHTT